MILCIKLMNLSRKVIKFLLSEWFLLLLLLLVDFFFFFYLKFGSIRLDGRFLLTIFVKLSRVAFTEMCHWIKELMETRIVAIQGKIILLKGNSHCQSPELCWRNMKKDGKTWSHGVNRAPDTVGPCRPIKDALFFLW